MGRANIGGELFATNYGRLAALVLDPIEKKPFYHFHPGSKILSIAPNGCNFGCLFCQNHSISLEEAPSEYYRPDEIVKMALSSRAIGIAYTYSEPLIWFEYVYDLARAARSKGLVNALVSNGFIELEPFNELAPFIDAINIDIKSLDQAFYKKIVKGRLDPVLTITRAAARSGIHLEITNLLIPTLNDSDENIGALVDFIAGLDRKIALHFSRYRPARRLGLAPSSDETLLRAGAIASRKLDNVYIGNARLDSFRDTRCRNCSSELVRRPLGGPVTLRLDRDGACLDCASPSGIRLPHRAARTDS